VVVVRDLVDQIDDLRLDGGRLTRGVGLRYVSVALRLVLGHALAHLPGEVEARKARVAKPP
jgi:hypothetical protein